MVEHSRYSVGGKEGTVVLSNKKNISDDQLLTDIETLLLQDTYEHFLEKLKSGKLKFTTKLLFDIHGFFLDPLYTWAGKARTVEISKGTSMFCASAFIKNELKAFDILLKDNFPTATDTKKSLAAKLALFHAELNAIHPFREGNGRVIRLFIDLLALNVGYDFVDYSKSSRAEYMKACIAGMQKDYLKFERVIFNGLKKL